MASCSSAPLVRKNGVVPGTLTAAGRSRADQGGDALFINSLLAFGEVGALMGGGEWS